MILVYCKHFENGKREFPDLSAAIAAARELLRDYHDLFSVTVAEPNYEYRVLRSLNHV